jgi:N6-adenosine-specific RNA methylase IME4
MTSQKLNDVEVRSIGLSGIASLPGRMRSLRPEVVETLAQSMATNGLLQPIVVRPREGLGFYLVAGSHRLEAARKLKWEGIRATIVDGMNVDSALLAEIDENLIRADLSPAEQAAHHAARKEIYERLHPETKRGVAGGKARQGSASDNLSFAEDTAGKTGVNKRTVERSVARGRDIPNVADLAGTALDKGEELDALAKLSPDRQEVLIDRAKAGERVSAKTEVKKEARAAREKALGKKQLALPDKRYGVILADPEWQYEPWSRETGMDRAAANHYPTSILPVIVARDVPSISAKDCILFLWATIPMLPHALVVMAAWGFDYKSHYAWGKDKFGTGYWNREKHELLLIGTRGNIPCPAPGDQWDSLVMAPRGAPSEKPECFLEMIEQYYPNLPKIELNRRGPARPSWDAWGFEAEEAVSEPPEVAPNQIPALPLTDSTSVAPDLDVPEFLRRARS